MRDERAVLEPSPRRSSLVEQTVGLVMNWILSREYDEGDYLPTEGELSRRFGVSRTTIREAIRSLEVMGFVERRQGIGVFVVNRSSQLFVDAFGWMTRRNDTAMADLLEARRLIECEAARLAATRATAEGLAKLDQALAPMRDPQVGPESYVSADLNFHVGIVHLAGNSVYVTFTHAIRSLLKASIFSTLRLDGYTESRLLHHERILRALQRGDPDASEQAMRQHFEATEDALRHVAGLAKDDGTN